VTHARPDGAPRPPRKRRPWRLPPMGHRTLILGVGASVVGITGAIRGVANGASILEVLALLAVGALGVVLAVAYVIAYSNEKR
jgi:hypothetical protein